MQGVTLLLAALSAFAYGAPTSTSSAPRPSTTTLGTIYAYGTNISGLPIFASSENNAAGTGVIASVGNMTKAHGKKISWKQVTHSQHNNSYLVAGDGAAGSLFYINRAAKSLAPAGFLKHAHAHVASSVETTTAGFFFFSGYLSYLEDSGQVLSEFWAVPSSSFTGNYDVIWNSDNQGVADGTPVALKLEAPY